MILPVTLFNERLGMRPPQASYTAFYRASVAVPAVIVGGHLGRRDPAEIESIHERGREYREAKGFDRRLLRAARGTRYATTAMRAAINWAGDVRGLSKALSHTQDENTAARCAGTRLRCYIDQRETLRGRVARDVFAPSSASAA